MKKCKIGVVGIGRGKMVWRYSHDADNAEIVAICDKWAEGLKRVQDTLNADTISYYNNFEDFLKHDMDVVILANYATEHAPFAIKAMEAGRMVLNACLHSLAARGYKSVVLSTDDGRIPALKLYLSLGFEPLYTHESHKERWEKVMEVINGTK